MPLSEENYERKCAEGCKPPFVQGQRECKAFPDAHFGIQLSVVKTCTSQGYPFHPFPAKRQLVLAPVTRGFAGIILTFACAKVTFAIGECIARRSRFCDVAVLLVTSLS